ncbi:chromosome alignment-maintaining phosphoprotein 1-like [Xiphophorus maculatus]|uniref:chromosome alignment-maintaining phosphoprotein 1-like n=1 Tax=Xiphophorus maculatus TaxID=8083 RepID=UPI000C6D496C|nr:chromosome alignment-maintaining phosphoprotein 1-like [Xiphophorus maculatus]
MSVFIHTRGEAGGGVAAHLRCSHCGHLSKSHAQQLAHLAASHPTCLDDVAVGRLGNILMYQSSARLFHCSECFHTCKDFSKLYKHIIARHCMVEKEEEGGGGGEEGQEAEEVEGRKDEEKLEGPKRKRSSDEEEEDSPENKKKCEDGEKAAAERKQVEKEEGKMKSEEEEEIKKNEEEKEEGKRKNKEEEGKRKSKEEEQCEGKAGEEEKQYVLTFDGVLFHCKICGWSHRQRSVSVSHIVRKHEIPKSYASHALAKSRQLQTGRAEEEDGAGMSEELMKEEMEVAARWVGSVSHRFVCLVCNWKSKLKGFVLTHIERYHEVERPYRCSSCPQSFFLPSRLQQHARTAHRPGRYACPFCWFRSEVLGGFRRHCSRCSAREEEELPGEEEEEEETKELEPEERKETRGMRRRRSLGRRMEEEELEEEEDD